MKRLIAVLFFLVLFSGVAMAQFANHPRYALIDTLVKSLITKVQVAQATYFAANQAYFQGIITPSTIQSGDVDAIPNWNVAPSDQITSWRDFDPTTFKTNFKVPFQLRIDVYESPRGWGWILTIEVWKDGLGPDETGRLGNHWVYRHHDGPSPFADAIFDKWYIQDDNPI